jgi:hypothetical protein
MERSLTLFRNLIFVLLFYFYQPAKGQEVKCDCSNKRVQDSLVEKYLVKGANRHNYNGPVWQQYCDSLIALCADIAVTYQQKAIPYINTGIMQKLSHWRIRR